MRTANLLHVSGRLRSRPSFSRATALLGCALLPLALGCAPLTQLNESQARNRALTAQNAAQLTEIENLKTHTRSVEDQLATTEKQLASLQRQVGLDHAQLTNYERERAIVGEEVKSLNYTSPQPLSRAVQAQLADLTKRYPSMRFDTATGIAKFDCDVLFASGEAELQQPAKDMLLHLARVLKGPEGAGLKVMVVGHTDDLAMAKRPARDVYPDNFRLSTARALNVADCLRKAGLAEGRIGIAGMGAHEPVAANQTDKDRQRNRRVEIFIMPRETPVVGWTETTPTLYR